jgi:hypothetical protein
MLNLLGLPLPGSSRFTRQLVQNAIPTILGSLLEPIWLELNRLFCLLQPFATLSKRPSIAKKSLSLDYESLPPQFKYRRLQRTHPGEHR